MDTEQKIYALKKKLVLLQINKVTKQEFKSHKVKKIQHQLSQMQHLNNNKQ